MFNACAKTSIRYDLFVCPYLGLVQKKLANSWPDKFYLRFLDSPRLIKLIWAPLLL